MSVKFWHNNESIMFTFGVEETLLMPIGPSFSQVGGDRQLLLAIYVIVGGMI